MGLAKSYEREDLRAMLPWLLRWMLETVHQGFGMAPMSRQNKALDVMTFYPTDDPPADPILPGFSCRVQGVFV